MILSLRLLVHGTADTSVPSRSAVDFAEALQAAGAEVDMKLYPGQPWRVEHADVSAHKPISVRPEISVLYPCQERATLTPFWRIPLPAMTP